MCRVSIIYQTSMEINMNQQLRMVKAVLNGTIIHTVESDWVGNSVSGE